jgi:hypothetical protein
MTWQCTDFVMSCTLVPAEWDWTGGIAVWLAIYMCPGPAGCLAHWPDPLYADVHVLARCNWHERRRRSFVPVSVSLGPMDLSRRRQAVWNLMLASPYQFRGDAQNWTGEHAVVERIVE